MPDKLTGSVPLWVAAHSVSHRGCKNSRTWTHNAVIVSKRSPTQAKNHEKPSKSLRNNSQNQNRKDHGKREHECVHTHVTYRFDGCLLLSTPPARVSRERHLEEGVITRWRCDLNSVLQGGREGQRLALGVEAARKVVRHRVSEARDVLANLGRQC